MLPIASILRSFRGLVAASLFCASAAPALAEQPAVLLGRILTAAGAPVAGAEIRVAGTSRRTASDAEGRFRFELPSGAFALEVESPRAGVRVVAVELAAGEERSLEIRLDATVHRESIVVTASPDARTLDDVAQPVSVLDSEELLVEQRPTIGETLARLPGIHASSYTAGSSRPVIRGLSGDRIRVLTHGIGTGDVSTTSPDHAVAVETLGAERIEIVRGPATLLYGSSAIGGVVNVIDDSIPDYRPEERVSGSVELLYGSAAREKGGAAELVGTLGPLVWHLDVARREADDYEIPGRPEAEQGEEEEEHEEEPFDGQLANSAVETESGTFGLSWVGRDGFLGLSVSAFDTLFGIPGHAHGHGAEEPHDEARAARSATSAVTRAAEEEGEEPPVRSDLEQRRLDLRGELQRPFGVFRGAKLRLGVADYEHRELEGDEVGTLFLNDSWEARLELPHRRLGALSGALGLQASRRDFEARGEESFTPPSTTENWGLFAFEELARGKLTWQFGLRYERQENDVEAPGVPDRSFAGLSASLGAAYSPGEEWGLVLSLARSTKLPNAEELYSNGPHAATRSFEIGDPDLDEEKSLGVDLALRKKSGRLTGELALFVNRFDGFIFERPTGEFEDELPVFRFGQADAEFWGGELDAHLELLHVEPHHLELDLMADFVRAELAESGEPLPRIPPLRFGAGLHYRGERLWARIEARRIAAQRRTAEFETDTDGYETVGAAIGYRFFAGGAVHDLVLSGANLTDELARNHASFLKDEVPLPGRDLRLAYRLRF